MVNKALNGVQGGAAGFAIFAVPEHLAWITSIWRTNAQ
jgi:hypothetical protein